MPAHGALNAQRRKSAGGILTPQRRLLTRRSKALETWAFRIGVAGFRTQRSSKRSNLAHQEDAMPVDFSPLYRSAVGFDRMAAMLDAAAGRDNGTGYPPYNIELVSEDHYLIEIVVAGFRPDELGIEVRDNVLTVQGRKANKEDNRHYLHRGLAERDFERRFQLADHVVVTDARLNDGLLAISLRRELPEQLKPRRIEINKGGQSEVIEGRQKRTG
jgi:molecular chaperone IbpA